MIFAGSGSVDLSNCLHKGLDEVLLHPCLWDPTTHRASEGWDLGKTRRSEVLKHGADSDKAKLPAPYASQG